VEQRVLAQQAELASRTKAPEPTVFIPGAPPLPVAPQPLVRAILALCRDYAAHHLDAEVGTLCEALNEAYCTLQDDGLNGEAAGR
jgi:hypothetical protein